MTPLAAALPINELFRNHPGAEQTLEQALGIIRPDFHMGWDLFLALFPLVLALFLFQEVRKIQAWIWWPLWACFVAFLPNAPYVLTDVIHFVEKIRVTPPLPLWATSLLLLEFLLYFSIGLQSFTFSLMLWGSFLKRNGASWLIVPLELLMLVLSAFGMYLGRIDRLNSWNLLTRPGEVMDRAVLDLYGQRPEELTLIFLAALFLLYYAAKGMNLLVLWLLGPLHPPRAVKPGEPEKFDLRPLQPERHPSAAGSQSDGAAA